jgi:hypothetical protein
MVCIIYNAPLLAAKSCITRADIHDFVKNCMLRLLMDISCLKGFGL